MKSICKIIHTKDMLYGFTDNKGNVYVNIELIYKQEKTVLKFIKAFSTYYTHEVLHSVIQDIVFDKDFRLNIDDDFDTKYFEKYYSYGEEKVARLLNKQSFTKYEQSLYKPR